MREKRAEVIAVITGIVCFLIAVAVFIFKTKQLIANTETFNGGTLTTVLFFVAVIYFIPRIIYHLTKWCWR